MFIQQTKSNNQCKDYTKMDYYSIKYDGCYMQVHIRNGTVDIFTSSGKTVNNKSLKDKFIHLDDIVLEIEFLGDNIGTLGDRDKIQKDIGSNYIAFDIINNMIFKDRLEILKKLDIKKVEYHNFADISQLKNINSIEGYVLKSKNHRHTGKRTNLSLKYKFMKEILMTVHDIIENYIIVKKDNVSQKVLINKILSNFINIGDSVLLEYSYLNKKYIELKFVRLHNVTI